jgi:hypothetical protein
VASLAAEVRGLAEQVGTARFVEVCVALLRGADRTAYVAELRPLTGFGFAPGSPELDPARWQDYWVRTWGARGLLHVWADAAGPAVLAGLGDPHWRPVEMCLKVVARHEVAGAADVVAPLAGHERARVRAQVARALAVVGDTEHAAALRRLLADPDPAVAAAADRALPQLSDRLGLPTDGTGK